MTDLDAVQTEIVDAARSYFLRFGYSRVSTDEIARSIGRSKKTLYKHFETKEALLQAVLGRINQDVESDLLSLFEDTADADYVEKLETMLGKVAMHLASTVGVLFEDLRTRSTELYGQTHGERQSALVTVLRGYVQRGVDAGHLRQDIDLDAVLRVFLSSAEAVAGPVDIAQAGGAVPEPVAVLVRLTVDGLRVRS